MSQEPVPDTAAVDRLRCFLDSYAGHQAKSKDPTQIERLMSFLCAVAPLLKQAQAHQPVIKPMVALSSDRFSNAMCALHAPLRRAQRRGDFLQVWAVAGLKRNEVRNAAVLAWLLNPQGSHGCGTAILEGLLSRAAHQEPSWPVLASDLSRVDERTEETPLGSDRDRVDIAIDGLDFVLFLEVKIDAGEGKHQLHRYAEAAREKANAMRRTHALVIFLSPKAPKHLPVGVAALTWRDVASTLSAVSTEDVSGALVRQYAMHIQAFF